MVGFINSEKADVIIKKLLLIFMVIVVTAASFCGFFSKWSFRDDAGKSFGIEAMLDGTANRPFVYRQLVPKTSKAIVSLLPDQAKAKLEKNLQERKPAESIYARAQAPENYRIEYYLMIIICYGCFVASTWLLRSLLCEVWGDKAAGTLGALSFALLIPFLETLGGYYYDFPELLFFVMAVRFSMSGNWLALLILAPIATLNKESFFFFLPALYPFFRQTFNLKYSRILVVVSIMLSGLAYLFVRQQYMGNGGGMVELHLMDHITKLFQLRTYYVTSTTYGLPLGAQMFFLHIIFVLWVAKYSWKWLTAMWKQHTKIALVITIPLYLLFCSPGELRNLSFLYMAFCVMITYVIHDLLKRQYIK